MFLKRDQFAGEIGKGLKLLKQLLEADSAAFFVAQSRNLVWQFKRLSAGIEILGNGVCHDRVRQVVPEITHGFESFEEPEKVGPVGIKARILDEPAEAMNAFMKGEFGQASPPGFWQRAFECFENGQLQCSEVEDEVSDGAGPIEAVGSGGGHARRGETEGNVE